MMTRKTPQEKADMIIQFQKAKERIIEVLNEIENGDEPHVIFIAGKVHSELKFLTNACPSYMIEAGQEIIKMGIDIASETDNGE